MPAPPAEPARTSNRTRLLILLFVGFILTGIATVIMGPILPLFISRWSLSDSQAGLFFSVQFASSLCGVWITTGLMSWRGYRPGLLIGYVLTGLGLALLNAHSQGVALFATAAFGAGYGMVVPPTNLCAGEIGGKHSAGLISLLNFAWGVGAVACSPLILLALRHQFLQTFLYGLALFAFALSAAFLFVAFPVEKHSESSPSGQACFAVPGIAITISVAALFFIYVGTETCIGGWAAEHVKRLGSHGAGMSTVAPLFFYAGMLTGRGLATVVLLRIRELYVVLTGLMFAIAGSVVIIAAKSQGAAMAGLAVAGFGCASVYPIYIAWFSKWYGAAARRIGGVVFSMASLGGSAMPLLVGFISTQAGSLRVGLLVPLAGCLVMLAGMGLLHRQRLV